MNNVEKLHALDLHRRRLEHLVGEMLRKTDDLDQASKYATVAINADWRKRLENTCNELVLLSETVQQIATLINNGDSDAAQNALLRSTDIATHISGRLRELKYAAGLERTKD